MDGPSYRHRSKGRPETEHIPRAGHLVEALGGAAQVVQLQFPPLSNCDRAPGHSPFLLVRTGIWSKNAKGAHADSSDLRA